MAIVRNSGRFSGGGLIGDMKEMQTFGCGVVLHHLLMVLLPEIFERIEKRVMEKNKIL